MHSSSLSILVEDPGTTAAKAILKCCFPLEPSLKFGWTNPWTSLVPPQVTGPIRSPGTWKEFPPNRPKEGTTETVVTAVAEPMDATLTTTGEPTPVTTNTLALQPKPQPLQTMRGRLARLGGLPGRLQK